MLTEDGKHLYISQAEYEDLIENLAVSIYQSNWQFDTVLCLARGGLPVGDMLSRVFKKPLAIMSTSSYHGEEGKIQGSIAISKYISTPHGDLQGNILLVDDLSDTGITLSEVARELKTRYSDVKELRTAVLWVKQQSTFTPDYCAQQLEGNPWIYPPNEAYEYVTPQELVDKWKNRELVN